MGKQGPIKVDGVITETLPNATFKVSLENGHSVLAHISGKMRMNFIKILVGDRVTVELVSKDVAHGLAIDGYPVDLHADPGQTARVTFVAGRAGTFKIRCSIACGNLHPFMIGKLQVGQNTLLWRAIVLSGLALVGGAWALKK